MKDAVAAAAAAVEVAAEDGAEGEDPEQPATKRRRIAPSRNRESDTTARVGGRKTRSQSRKIEETYDETLVIEDSQDEDFEPEPEPSMLLTFELFFMLFLTASLDDGFVSCPMCERRMKNEAVFSHLDTCTGSEEKPKPQR